MAQCKQCLIKPVHSIRWVGLDTKDSECYRGLTQFASVKAPKILYLTGGDHSQSNINQCPLSFLSISSDSYTVLQLHV